MASAKKKHFRGRCNTKTIAAPSNKKWFEVRQVLASRITRLTMYFKLQWKGYALKEASWVPRLNCKCPQLIEKFEREEKKKLSGCKSGTTKDVPVSKRTRASCNRNPQMSNIEATSRQVDTTLIRCILCGAMVQQKHLSDHVRAHTVSRKPYKCTKCSSKFATKGNLLQHMERMHILKCLDCGLEFINHSVFTRHLKQRTVQRAYQCQFCCASLATKRGLQNHHYKFHKEAPFILIALEKASVNPLLQHLQNTSNTAKVNPRIHNKRRSAKLVPRTKNLTMNKTFKQRRFATTRSIIRAATKVVSTHVSARRRKIPHKAIQNRKKSGCSKNRVTKGLHRASSLPISRTINNDLPPDLQRSDGPAVFQLSAARINDLPPNLERSDAVPYVEEDNAAEINNDLPPNLEIAVYLPDAQKNTNELSHDIEMSDDDEDEREDYEVQEEYSDFDDSFVLATWKISNKTDCLEKIYGQSQTLDMGIHHTLRFLRGETLEMSLDDLLSLVNNSVTKLIGLFPAALMIIDTASSNQNISWLLSLYEACNRLDVRLQHVVKTVVVFHLKCEFEEGHIEFDKFLQLPHQLRESCSVNFVNGQKQQREYNPDQTKSVRNEETSISDIMDVLVQLIYDDMSSTNTLLTDDSYTFTDRAMTWVLNLYEYVCGIVKQDHKHFLNLILWKEMQKQATSNLVLAAYVLRNTVKTPLYVHGPVLKRFGGSPGILEKIVVASDEEVDTFLTLLYLRYKPSKHKGKITLAVFELAKEVHLKDKWYFIFRNNNFLELTDERNRNGILRILLLMGKFEQLDDFARAFNKLFSGPNATKCLNDLPSSVVKYFLDKTTLRVSEETIYRIMIQWSHDRVGKPCQDEMAAEFDPNVDEEFKTVRSVLRLRDLKSHFNTLYAQGFITAEDMQLALQKHIDISDERVWFSTRFRERNE